MEFIKLTSPSARKSILPPTLKVLLLTVSEPAAPPLVVMLAETLPVPVMALVMLVSTDRTKVRLALFVTAPAPNVPVVPPSPTCKVPPLTVVVPL